MIAVLDYGIGNLGSAAKALVSLGCDARLVSDPGGVAGAAGVVLPGVGAFGRCMEALRASGLDAPVKEAVDGGVPFLGICVGFQMLYETSDESPGISGLGLLPGRVSLLPPGQKRPQMQWNSLDPVGRESVMLAGLGARPWVYFVHSFAPVPTGWDPGTPAAGDVVATCSYGGAVVAAVERGNLWAVQFHPEKSGATGLALLANFVAHCGAEMPDAPSAGGAGGEE
ncbi:MAG: imidazole glycerol phosphate synthase subunit HisH [Acidimicrobiales bacterium]